jgi:hypothetical protein
MSPISYKNRSWIHQNAWITLFQTVIDPFGGVDRCERKMITRFLVRLLFSQNFVSPCEYFPRTSN